MNGWELLAVLAFVMTLSFILGFVTNPRSDIRTYRERDKQVSLAAAELTKILSRFATREDGLAAVYQAVNDLKRLVVLAYLPENTKDVREAIERVSRDAFRRVGLRPPENIVEDGLFDIEEILGIRHAADRVQVLPDYFSRTVMYVCASGGAVALLAILFNGPRLVLNSITLLDTLFVSSAWAATTAPRYDIAALVPYFLILVVGLMSFSFIGSLYVALTTPTVKGTVGKRRTAENVVKMTGSFLIGFAMALLK